MTLINLTEKYLGENQVSWFRKRRILRHPDLYYATSLAEVEKTFIFTPPRRIGSKVCARLIMDNLKIKAHVTDFERKGNAFADYLEEDIYKTWYDISDFVGTTILATWEHLDLIRFTKYRQLGINSSSFIRIPRMFLKYEIDNDLFDLMDWTSSHLGYNDAMERTAEYRVLGMEAKKPNLRKPKSLDTKVLQYAPVFQPI